MSVDIILQEAKTNKSQFGKTDITWKVLHCSSVSLIIDDNADWYIKISIDEGFSSTEQLRKFVLDKLVEYEIVLKDEKGKIVIISEL